MKEGRDDRGRFTQGNPGGGRKKLMPREFHERLKDNAASALDCIIEIMENQENKPELRLKAATFIIENAFGKAVKDEQEADIKRAYTERKRLYLKENPIGDASEPMSIFDKVPREVMEEAIL